MATGRLAIYEKQSEIIILTGEAQVWQGQNRILGERITVFLNEERSVAEGGSEQNVEAVVYSTE